MEGRDEPRPTEAATVMSEPEPPAVPAFVVPVMSHREASFVARLGERLQSDGTPVSFVPKDEFLAKTARVHVDADDLHAAYLDHDPGQSFAALVDKYDIESPRSFVFPQMVYDYRYRKPGGSPYFARRSFGSPDYEPYFDLLRRTLDYLDEVYESGRGGVPIQYQGAEVLRRALQRVADHHGIPSVWVGHTALPGHSGLSSDEGTRWSSFQSDEPVSLTPYERERARAYVDDVRDREVFVTDLDEGETAEDNVRRKMRRVREYGGQVRSVGFDWLRRKLGRPLRARLAARHHLGAAESRAFVEENDFVFFPLQFYRESRVTMRAPAFYDQAWLVEYLSRSVPHGTELVVKDHPHRLGTHSSHAVRAFARHATLVSPDLPAADLVEEAAAVVTLNGTVGYEAVIQGKPVVCLGRAFYGGRRFLHRVDDINDLDDVLRDAIDSSGPDEADIVEFAHRILEGSYPGVWQDDSPENVRRMARSVRSFLSLG